MFEVVDKVVFVTGGAKGIGAVIVKQFLQRGAKHVAFLDVDKNSGTELEDQMKKTYGKNKVKFIECDITNDEQLSKAYESVLAGNECIDVVINNAGIATENSTTFKKLIDINYSAVVSSTFKALEIMRRDKGGKGGTVINISSIAALAEMFPTYVVYAGSKGAVLQFTNLIGVQDYYKQTGVRMMTVCFGITKTKILDEIIIFDPLLQQKSDILLKKLPLQSVDTAALGLIEAFQMGNSGDTWVVTSGKPAMNITDRVKKAFDILSEGLLN